MVSTSSIVLMPEGTGEPLIRIDYSPRMTTSTHPLVAIEAQDGIATLWLDRPDKRNALDGALMASIAGALDAVRDDATVRVVVLRGRGPVFSSGIDHTFLLEVFQKSRAVPFAHLHHDLQDVFHRLERMHKPTVAVLHKACVGMALELALACDFRIATADCALGLPEIAFGIVPDVGGTTRLTRLIGAGRARELILTGKIVSAATAERIGLVNEIAKDDQDLSARLGRLTGALAAHPPAAVGMAKALVAASADGNSAGSFRLEGVVQQVLMGQPDLATQFPLALAFIKRGMAAPE
jgi:enoyl-CoA hydratase/carnithine racemase